MRTTAVLILATVLFDSLSLVAAEPPQKSDHGAADASLIAAWIVDMDDEPAPFKMPFGDRHFFADAKDALFYTDIEGVDVPGKLKRVPFDFIKARMDLIRNGHKRDPAVLITRSVADQPENGRLQNTQVLRKRSPNERVYYIEVAIGNLAWHWMKIVVYEEDGQKEVEFLWSAVS